METTFDIINIDYFFSFKSYYVVWKRTSAPQEEMERY